MNKDGCECERCGRYYKVDLMVSDELWKLIKYKAKPCDCIHCSNRSDESGLFCASCIMERIEDLNEFAAFKLVPL